MVRARTAIWQCHALAAHDGEVFGQTLDVAAALSEMALIYEHKGDYKRWPQPSLPPQAPQVAVVVMV